MKYKTIRKLVVQSTTLLCSYLLSVSFALADLPDPLPVSSGYIKGSINSAQDISVYKGIPYAAPPIAQNRWRDPQPVPSWTGVRPATEPGPRCVQRGFQPGTGETLISEDCLYLNVFSPANSVTDNLPVMVWIHGGGFFGGSGADTSYDGNRLASKGVIVVTINYRLGSFGFLALPELNEEGNRQSSGNYGLMDMIESLHWVKENIHFFGGNPENVTIFGESAGAQSVTALLASPLTDSLFQKAIVQSAGWFGWMGTDMPAYPTLEEKELEGLQMLESFGADSLDELRMASTQDVYAHFPPGGEIIVDGAVLPDDPAVIFSQGRQQKVPLLAGSNESESVFFGPGPGTSDEFITSVQSAYGSLADNFLDLYPAPDDEVANTSYHASFNHQVSWQMRQMALSQVMAQQDAYVYYFTHVPPMETRGATHTTELAYVLNQTDQHPEWETEDIELANTMSSYWANFARSGDPNDTGLPAWPIYTGHETGKVQVFGDVVETETVMEPTLQNLNFFSRVFERYLQSFK